MSSICIVFFGKEVRIIVIICSIPNKEVHMSLHFTLAKTHYARKYKK